MNISSLKYCLLFVATLLYSCKGKQEETVLNYPVLPAGKTTDTYFGKTVNDPYRILENEEDPAVKKWVELEKNLCDSVLNKISFRDSLETTLKEMIYSSNIRGGFPRVINKKLFFTRIYVMEQVEKLFYKDSLSAPETELFSTASLNQKEESFTIDFFEPSSDGRYVAFGLSSNGDEMASIHIIDVSKKQMLPEVISRANYGIPFWAPGKDCFFYAQLKETKTEEDRNTMYEDPMVKLHWIGNDPQKDKEVFSRKTRKELDLGKIDFSTIFTFPGSDKVVAFTVRGSTPYMALRTSSLEEVTAKNENATWKNICSADDKVTSFALYDQQLYVLSFNKNPNGTLKRINLSNIAAGFTIVEEGRDDVLEDIVVTDDLLYLKKLKNGNTSIIAIDPVKNKMEQISLPFNGYAYLKTFFEVPSTSSHTKGLYFAMESWNKEIGIYYYDPGTKKIIKTELRATGKYGDASNVEVKETEVKSKDGTMVPLSIMYMKGTALDGNNPTLLEAYGAYGASMNAGFDLSLLTWLKMGGIYAVAHVRGGGEKGDSWYKGGYKANKPNSWKDFIACAEYLVDNHYASTSTLAGKATSAGGITVGRAVTERPDLFKAAILDVSVLNAVRHEKTHNTVNVTEHGSVADEDGFKGLYEMDVYQHISNDTKYPALLITAGLNDARVDLWQPGKAVAKFQEAARSTNNIVLFKVNSGGHSGDQDKVKETADYYSFLLWQLGNKKFTLQK